MRGGTDRVPDIGIIVSGHTSLRNADRRSNQSVAALGALVCTEAWTRGCAPRPLPLFAAGLGAALNQMTCRGLAGEERCHRSQ